MSMTTSPRAETDTQPDPVDSVLLPGFAAGRENLAILKVFAGLSGPHVLDIGCYRGGATLALALMGKRVDAITIGAFWPRRLAPILAPRGIAATDIGFEAYTPAAPFDGIWASHVLEHSRNPGAFLDRCRGQLKEDGWLAVVVPPFRPRVIAGHVSPGWNLGVLMYNLVAAGFDIKRGHFVTHGHNVAALVPKAAGAPPRQDDAFADRALWPFPFDRRVGFDGAMAEFNWPAEFRERMNTGLSELAVEGGEAALAAARTLAAIWV
jgi:SAM-dependent methyltransferase